MQKNKIMMRLTLLLVLTIAIFSCSEEIINPKNYSYEIPVNNNDGILVQDIRAYNVDTILIAELNKKIIDEEIYNIHSILIYKDDALFFEKYLCGKDEKHGENLGIIQHNINTLHDSRSISKSIVSACIGIAIQKGLIKDEYEPIKNYLSYLEDNQKGDITIKDLLKMSSGLCWKEMGYYNGINDETKMDLNLDPVSFVLKKDLISQPGSTWNYSGGNTQILADIIHRVSGQSICEFATEHLFNPLGVSKKEWVNLTMKKIPAAASGLRLTSRDLLKFGILYKNNGIFNNVQIIDSSWINKSISEHIQRPDLTSLNLENGGYGYQFWTYEFKIKNNDLQVIEAKGNGGQSIFICKQLDLIVVITAGNYGKLEHNTAPYKILKEYILNSFL